MSHAGTKFVAEAARSTRRRGAALEEAILRAAAQVLGEAGFAGMTKDEVARRAGTNKNAIYRRWPSRPALGIAAYRHLAEAQVPIPDTGSLRADALQLLRWANATLSSPEGVVLRELFAAAADEPELLDLLRQQAGGSAMNAAWQTALDRAVTRGEAPPEATHSCDEVFLPLARGRAAPTLGRLAGT